MPCAGAAAWPPLAPRREREQEPDRPKGKPHEACAAGARAGRGGGLSWPPRAAWLFIALVGAAAAAPSPGASQADALVGLINAHRAAPPPCAGRQPKPAAPLAPDTVLARVPLAPGVPLQEALKDAGYTAARSLAISVSGPADAASALRLLAVRYCDALSSPQYAEIGVAQEGRRWRIVLARPLLPADLGDWPAAGRRVLALANAARATPRHCGARRFDAAPPLRWNDRLAAAARSHSGDMAAGNFFAHEGSGGSQVGDRARRQGYAWRAVGENIAAGQGSPEQVMAGWLASPGHCANLMHAGFAELGAAYAIDRDSEATIYWTQVFGTAAGAP